MLGILILLALETKVGLYTAAAAAKTLLSLCFSKPNYLYSTKIFTHYQNKKVYNFFHILLFRSFSQNTERSPETTSTSMSSADLRYADRIWKNCILTKGSFKPAWMSTNIDWNTKLASEKLSLESSFAGYPIGPSPFGSRRYSTNYICYKLLLDREIYEHSLID